MSLDPRFEITPYFKQRRFHTPIGPNGGVRDGFWLNDTLTGHGRRFDLKRDAVKESERILEREQALDWARIHSYDFHHSSIPRPCTEVYAYDEQGERVLSGRGASIALTAYDRDAAVVKAHVERWLDAMGHADLPRKADADAERERRAHAAIFETAAPGIRSRPSALAAERSHGNEGGHVVASAA